MAGHGDPPDGPPEGAPDGPPGGDDEYRSVVFDESFVRAAHLQEFSARERMSDHAHPVRNLRGPGAGRVRATRNGPRQLLALFLLVALAFGAAVYLGFRQPYSVLEQDGATPLAMTVVPLAPPGIVAGGTPAALIAAGPARTYETGAQGIPLPDPVSRTGDFTEDQVASALQIARDYLVASALNPDVLAGRDRSAVRVLLDPAQTAQFDRSFTAPAADGRHEPAGWLVGFDPREVTQVPGVHVHGTLGYEETSDQALEITADHTYVYVLRPAAQVAVPASAAGASLFTVRRQLRFRIDRQDLRKHRLEVVQSQVGAGPESCSEGASRAFQPLLAGHRAPAGTAQGVDPFSAGHLSGELCGVLTQPRPAAS